MSVTTIICRALRLLEPGDRLVRVKSWWPRLNGRELSWPTLLIERKNTRRETASAVWNWPRVRYTLRLERPRP